MKPSANWRNLQVAAGQKEIPGTLKNVAVLVSVATIEPNSAHQGMSWPASTYPTRSRRPRPAQMPIPSTTSRYTARIH